MREQEHWLRGKWQDYIWVVPSVYRFLAFTIATAQILLFPAIYQSTIPPLAVIIGVGVYTVIKVLIPLSRHQASTLGYSLLGADIAICIFLLIFTGGLHSPFLLYTLAPVLSAALCLDIKVTFSIGVLSGAYVIGSQMANPFFPLRFALSELSYFLVYVVAVWLVAALPYLINVNIRQRLQSQGVLQERQRLSREIHDGMAQTTSVLCWQVQLLYRRLVEMGIELDEVRELARLAAKAHQDARESLEILRSYTGNGCFLPNLEDYLKHLRQDANIHFSLDIEDEKLHLEAPVELQLLFICQEALTNIRQHSGAHNIQVQVKLVNSHLKVSIADDGRGFDAVAYYNDGVQAKGHGLAVMQERAESVGGKLRVLSLPGRGTEIQVEVPATQGRTQRLLWLNR